MKLVTFTEPIRLNFQKSADLVHVMLDANKPYLFSTQQISNLIKTHEIIRISTYKYSDLFPRLRNFHVGARKIGSQRVLLYNGSAGYGDQILTWPISKILSDLGFEVHVLVDPGNMPCWLNFPWVKAVHNLPISMSVFDMFDYHAIFDYLSNIYEHRDLGHSVDIMLNKLGIDPQSVDPSSKVISPYFTEGELRSMFAYFPDKEIAMYQLTAATHIRSLTPDSSVIILAKLAQEFPEWHWLGLYDQFNDKRYAEALTSLQISNAEPYKHPMIRELWAMVRRAKVVVAPDSMMVHAAGSQGAPCVGLWGPTDPNNRVRYYANHVPIFKSKACPHAACNNYLADWPKYCPPRENREMCDVVAAITAEEVIAAVYKAIGSSPEKHAESRGNVDKAVSDWRPAKLGSTPSRAEVQAP